MKSRIYTRLSGGFAVLVGLLAAPIAHAQRVTILPSCTVSGNCTLCDFVTLAANISQFILSLIGGIVLAMVVLGGFMWLVSGGASERVQKGKAILTGAVIGLVITLGAYMAVNAMIAGFLGSDFDDAEIFGQNWNEFCSNYTPSEVLKSCEDSDVGEINYGVPCNAGSCNDANVCVCYSGSCITNCEAQGAASTAAGDPVGSGCLVNAEDCRAVENSGSRSYVENAGGSACPTSAPWCCYVGQ